MQKGKRYFNTSGPNIPSEHYTLPRKDLIEKGMDYVRRSRYFTIWAPRQTGKSTYFRLLADELERQEYKVCHINVENFRDAPLGTFLAYLLRKIAEGWRLKLQASDFGQLLNEIEQVQEGKYVLIVDEVEGLYLIFASNQLKVMGIEEGIQDTPLDKMVLDTESTETNTEYTECFPLIIRPLCDSVSSRRTLCPEKCLVVCIQDIEGVIIRVYIVGYDEEKDF